MNLISTIQTITLICEKYKDEALKSGENYNIFRVINRTTQEVGVHSAFIANLLSPSAEHGYRSVFLKLFLEELGINGFDANSAEVKVENYISVKTENEGGRIDIDISDKNGFHIIIENKIYARDQENQMVRYFNYGKYCDSFRLFYLTLYGNMPKEYSCYDKVEDITLEEGKDYHLLSYHSNIKQWLEKCREQVVDNPLLREGISHYLNLIKYLTNQTMSETLKDEIKKTLRNSETISNLFRIKESIFSLEMELQLDFWTKLKAKFKDSGKIITFENFEYGVEQYYTNLQNRKAYGFQILIKKNEESIISYYFEMADSIYCGFEISEGSNNQVNLKEEYAAYRYIAKEINSEYESSEGWLGCKKLQPILNFQNIDDETCKYLANLDETIDTIFNDVVAEIEEFKSKLDEI